MLMENTKPYKRTLMTKPTEEPESLSANNDLTDVNRGGEQQAWGAPAEQNLCGGDY